MVDGTEDLLRKLVRLQVGSILQTELKDDFERKLYKLTGNPSEVTFSRH